MQALKFSPLDRVIVERTDGDVDSWIVLHYLDGRVIVGCETAEGELTKAVPPAMLREWQEREYPQGIKCRPASLAQLDAAVAWADTYDRWEEG